MIRLLNDMPTGVLGLEAVDDIEKEDYENVFQPAVEAAIAEHGKVRLVYLLGHEFDEYEAEAVWEDVKLGARHPSSFARMGGRAGRVLRSRCSACCGLARRAHSRWPSWTPPALGSRRHGSLNGSKEAADARSVGQRSGRARVVTTPATAERDG
jgi:hypothetical protein